jgi:hypothetical protein
LEDSSVVGTVALDDELEVASSLPCSASPSPARRPSVVACPRLPTSRPLNRACALRLAPPPLAARCRLLPCALASPNPPPWHSSLTPRCRPVALCFALPLSPPRPQPLGFDALGPAATHLVGTWNSGGRREAQRRRLDLWQRLRQRAVQR